MNRIARIVTALSLTLAIGAGAAACSSSIDRHKSLENLKALIVKPTAKGGLGLSEADATCILKVANKLTDQEMSDTSKGKPTAAFTKGVTDCVANQIAATSTTTAATDSSSSSTAAAAGLTEADRPALETALTEFLLAPIAKGGYNVQPDAAACLVAISKNQPVNELALVASGKESEMPQASRDAFESSLATCIVNPTGTVAP